MAEKGGRTEVSEMGSAGSGGRQEPPQWGERQSDWRACRRRKERLTLDYTPGCSVRRGAEVMQIGIVAKKIGLSVDAIRFYEQRLAPKTAKNGRWLPTIWRKRRRNAGLRASRAGPGIQTQRDSGAFAGARESHAALRTGATPPARKTGRRTAETERPSQTGARAALSAAQLQ